MLTNLADCIPTMNRARRAVAKFTKPEIAEIMAPLKQCEKHLREGVATEEQVLIVCTGIRIALEIEGQGVMRGVHHHLQPALEALEAIHTRGNQTGQWQPIEMAFEEMDAVREGLEMHSYQLRYLSTREYQQAVRKLIMRTRSSGIEAHYEQPQNVGLSAVGAPA